MAVAHVQAERLKASALVLVRVINVRLRAGIASELSSRAVPPAGEPSLRPFEGPNMTTELHMRRDHRRALPLTSVLASALALSACGGGGGGVASTGTPTSTTAGTTTPTTGTPTTTTPITTTRSAEYLASGGVVGAKAGYAYDRSISGAGVTVAVIDTGADIGGSEFAGRISPDSRVFQVQVARCPTCASETTAFGLQDIAGHGTAVASVALAAANGSGIQGVAPGATLLALKVAGPDFTGVTAGSTTPIPEAVNGGYVSSNVAPALIYAVDKGAFVVNFSGNGGASPFDAAAQRAAMDRLAAGNRLLVQSVSNDTDQDSYAGQITQSLVGADQANRAWFLFGIGLDANLRPRTQNGLPGALADRTLAVVANGVTVTTIGGGTAVEIGNSFAAPVIAGAAALLKQYWPQLGGKEISQILLDTATDAGTAGVDQVYGKGILNVEAAMQAQAPTVKASSASAPVALAGSGITVSDAFGGAATATTLGGGLGRLVAIDRYGRDYSFDARGLVRSRTGGITAYGMTRLADAEWMPTPINQAGALGLAQGLPHRPATGGTMELPLAGGRSLSASFDAAIDGDGGLAGSTTRSLGLSAGGTTVAWRSRGLTVTSGFARARDGRGRIGMVEIAVPAGWSARLASIDERGQALGLAGTGAFEVRRGRTTLATIGAARRIGAWSLSGKATIGRTEVDGAHDLMRLEPVLSTAFSVQAARPLLGGWGTFGVSSPLRVQRARAILSLPVGYDLAADEVVTATRTLDLVPSARELDLELGWSARLSPTSSLRLGAAHAFVAGNVAGRSGDAAFLSLVVRP